ncbi:MAG: ATP-binding cassette domain-containing protein [Caldilineaceae bacterium]
MGKSGSGKSTLLNLISGIDAQQWPGDHLSQRPKRHLAALSEQQRTLFRRRHIWHCLPIFQPDPYLTVLENVTLPLELATAGAIAARARSPCSNAGLADRLDAYPDRLSGVGEQQRA